MKNNKGNKKNIPINLPRNLRKLANDYYKQHNKGRTVEQDGAYAVGIIIGRNLGKLG